MEKIKICKGINVSNKIFTQTWQDLEKFFGVPITEFGKVMQKKLKSIDEEISFSYVVISQDNDISKEELIKKIDEDEDISISILGTIKKIVNLFTKQLQESNDQGEGKKTKNQ